MVPYYLELEKWWQFIHRFNNKRILTGTNLNQIIDFLQLDQVILNSKTVLDIGSGTGKEVKDLHSLGKEVSVIDICPKALQKVEDYSVAQYLTRETKKLPKNYFDLAICFLVTSHCTDAMLLLLFLDVFKSLRKNGVLVIQYPEIPNYNSVVSLDNLQNGGVARSKETMDRLVLSAGGEIVTEVPIKTFLPRTVVWRGIHVKRRYRL